MLKKKKNYFSRFYSEKIKTQHSHISEKQRENIYSDRERYLQVVENSLYKSFFSLYNYILCLVGRILIKFIAYIVPILIFPPIFPSANYQLLKFMYSLYIVSFKEIIIIIINGLAIYHHNYYFYNRTISAISIVIIIQGDVDS